MQTLRTPIEILTAIAAAMLYGLALWRAPWRRWFEGHPDRLNVWGLTLAVSAILWSLRTDIAPGMPLQLLLVTTFTLMHGWALALIANGIIIAAGALLQAHGRWAGLPLVFLCDVALPAAFIELLHRQLSRRLPKNYLTYFFLTVFLGTLLAFQLSGVARLALLAAGGELPVRMLGEYAILLVMLGFANATINGMAMSAAVIYRPEWVVSFDPKLYFKR